MYIKRSGSNSALLICVLILTFILTSCAGLQDWCYNKLPNGYEIWRINSQDIVLIKRKGDLTDLKISRYILEFCYNNSYIGIKQLMIDENIPYQDVHIEEMDTSNPFYYLVDAVNDVVMGPYTAEDYEDQIEALEIDTMCDWIKTVPTPEGIK